MTNAYFSPLEAWWLTLLYALEKFSPCDTSNMKNPPRLASWRTAWARSAPSWEQTVVSRYLAVALQWQAPCCRFHIHLKTSDTAFPTGLNTPVITPISISLVLSFYSRGYSGVAALCNSPSAHEQLHKNKAAYLQESTQEGQGKSTPVCLFAVDMFPFRVASCISLLTPCLFFFRTGPSVHNNAGNLTLLNPSGQLALTPL